MNKPTQLIQGLLETSARRFPQKVACVHGNIRATYDEINTRANRFARWMIRSGIKAGDRVVMALENSVDYIIGYYGTLKSGAVFISLPTGIKHDGIRPLLAELEPAALITSGQRADIYDASLIDSTSICYCITTGANTPQKYRRCVLDSWDSIAGGDSGESDLAVPMADSALAAIIYTSGSTGKPKGTMLTHRNIVSNTMAICEYLRLTNNDIQMVVLPFSYVMGKSLLNTHVAVGGTVVINNTFLFPATVIKQMIEEKVTGFSGVPSTFAYLLHRSPLAKFRDQLTALRYCSQAGGHMSNQIKQELRRVLPDHTDIYIMYGATEASARLTYLDPLKYVEKMGSIGRAIPGVTMKVIDEKGNEMPPGQAGELVAEGPNIMLGYWKDPEATARVLDKHGYHTGDLGFRDGEGFLYVTGRKDETLKVGGHRINPQEIEDALMATELLMEAVVLGVPDEMLGKKLVACVSARNPSVSKDEILKAVLDKLPRYKLPADVHFIPSLPKNANGKIDRARCLELIRPGK